MADEPLQHEWSHDEPVVREEVGATIVSLMRWGLSILAHVALIVLAFFLFGLTIGQEGLNLR